MPEMLNSEKQIYLVLIWHWYVNMGLGNMDNMGNMAIVLSLIPCQGSLADVRTLEASQVVRQGFPICVAYL